MVLFRNYLSFSSYLLLTMKELRKKKTCNWLPQLHVSYIYRIRLSLFIAALFAQTALYE